MLVPAVALSHFEYAPFRKRSRVSELNERLSAAKLYLVCDAKPGGRPLCDVLAAAIDGGVDVVQLREKRLGGEALLAVAKQAAALCREQGALFIVNDFPQIARDAGADGVHVGQDDLPVAEVAAIVGADLLIGLSTHSPAEIDAVDPRADYIGVGPIHATPTKPGRPPVGLQLVSYAKSHAHVPFFAIGGIDERNLQDVLSAGAERICVLRAIAAAQDPRAAARRLRDLLATRAHSR